MRLALLLTLTLAACRSMAPATSATSTLPAGAEAVSLAGDTLRPPALPAETRTRYERQLADAEAELARSPDSPDALIWVGRRTAYLGRYRDAIAVFTRGVERFPNDARFYRHRGHRWITVRELDRAIADLEKAASLVAGKADEVEPDGMPNARGIPTSTLHSNIWYHLALAYYLKHDFERALPAWREGMRVATNDDMRVATAHWLYMTLRRLGRDTDAAAVLEPFRRDMDVIENQSYHRLLLLYRGELAVDSVYAAAATENAALADATVGYGVGNWHLYNGRREAALQLFRRILQGGQWASFGYIAAEAELASGGRATAR